jgi:hypothetical protein
MKKKLTSPEKANDPNSKINAALRVWKCWLYILKSIQFFLNKYYAI